MNKVFPWLAALAVLFLCPADVLAQQAAWRIATFEGAVQVTQPGAAAHAASANETLRAGTIVTTSAASRAVLENGLQRVTLAANSRITIAPDSTDAMTRILQDLGSVLFQVDRRQTPHFRVETPLLAAIVKGTTFTVTANPQQDLVHVAQGLVEVRANNGGASVDVPAGSSARIERDAPAQIASIAPSEVVASLSVATPTLSYEGVSNGVVDGPQHAESVSGGAAGADHANENAGGAFHNAGVENSANADNRPSRPDNGNAGGGQVTGQSNGNSGGNNPPADPGNSGSGGGNGGGGGPPTGNGNGGGDPGNGNNGGGNSGNGNTGGGSGNGNSGNGNGGNGNGTGSGNGPPSDPGGDTGGPRGRP